MLPVLHDASLTKPRKSKIDPETPTAVALGSGISLLSSWENERILWCAKA